MNFLLFNLVSMKVTLFAIASRLSLLLFCCLGILCSPMLLAQGQIGFNPNATLRLQDTVLTYNTSVTFYFSLQNFGSTPFQGTIDLQMNVLDSAGNVFSTGVEGSLSQLVLQPGDTTTADSIQITVSPARFPAGGGIVVIWPSAPGFGTPDTFQQQVNVSLPSALDANDAYLNASVIYPNPAQSYCCFPLPEARTYFLYSLQGARIGMLQSDAKGCATIPDLPAGQYLITDENQGTRYRLMLK